MDLSKLPKLSQTAASPEPSASAHPPAGAQQPAGQPYPAPAPPPAYPPQVVMVQPGGPEAWISAAMGAIMLLFGPRFLEYLFMSSASFAKKWTFSDAQGQPLSYPQTVFFWGDLVITAFGIVLILDGAVLMWGRSRAVIATAMAITILTVAGNLAYSVVTFGTYGLAMWSALAVVYGVFIAIYQWRMLKILQAAQRGAVQYIE